MDLDNAGVYMVKVLVIFVMFNLTSLIDDREHNIKNMTIATY